MTDKSVDNKKDSQIKSQVEDEAIRAYEEQTAKYDPGSLLWEEAVWEDAVWRGVKAGVHARKERLQKEQVKPWETSKLNRLIKWIGSHAFEITVNLLLTGGFFLIIFLIDTKWSYLLFVIVPLWAFVFITLFSESKK
jgi:hypothetical protein